MSTKTILIFQGGGALGAYECGAYQALAPHLDNLAVVAGTSIGAINSSLIASHYQTPPPLYAPSFGLITMAIPCTRLLV